MDSFFARYHMATQASIDLGLLMSEPFPGYWMEQSAKIQRLDQIVAEEIANNGKVLVEVEYIDEIKRLVDHYNRIYGPGSAEGIWGDVSPKKRDKIAKRFKGQPNPKILIGRSDAIGSSLNLYQAPGVSFHISTLVRLSRPWVNVDDAARLIGYGQDHQVRAITLISTFSPQAIEKMKEALAKMNQDGKAKEIPDTFLTAEEMLDLLLLGKKDIFGRTIDGRPSVADDDKEAIFNMARAIFQAKASPAMLVNGGIDLSKNHVNVLNNDTAGQMQFDRAMIARIKQDGFDGLDFSIESITPLNRADLSSVLENSSSVV